MKSDGSQGIRYSSARRSPIAFSVVEGDYEPEVFYAAAKGKEQCPEGGERCLACYELRLRKTAELAVQSGQDYFATTLTISHLKSVLLFSSLSPPLVILTIINTHHALSADCVCEYTHPQLRDHRGEHQAHRALYGT